MLMTAAAVHMDSAAHGNGPAHSTSTSPPPPPPWFPAGNHRLPRDFAASAAPTTPTPATATATAIAPPNHHHNRPSRRAAKRSRPRPSRKQPTTYIAADPASFRRMVHQVTGADDYQLPAAPRPETTTLCRPAPYRAGSSSAAGTGGAMVLPTLDTSAFLLGATGARADAPACAGSGGSAAPAKAEAGGACNYSGGNCGGGFPTLDSWDDAHLF